MAEADVASSQAAEGADGCHEPSARETEADEAFDFEFKLDEEVSTEENIPAPAKASKDKADLDARSVAYSVETAAKWIGSARAIIVGTGAGMGVDSGLGTFRGRNAGVWPALAELGIDYQEICTTRWFQEDPGLVWGFWRHCHRAYLDSVPHEGYEIIARWARGVAVDQGFSITTNIDEHWLRCMPANRVYEMHGSTPRVQCSVNCCDDIWRLPTDFDPPLVDGVRVEAAHIPRCPKCGEIARPNVMMFGDSSFNDEQCSVQRKNYIDWLKQIGAFGHRSKRPREKGYVVIVEIGAGLTVPTIRKILESHLREIPDAVLIRINLDDISLPEGVEGGRSVAIPLGAVDALRRIDRCIALRSSGGALKRWYTSGTSQIPNTPSMPLSKSWEDIDWVLFEMLGIGLPAEPEIEDSADWAIFKMLDKPDEKSPEEVDWEIFRMLSEVADSVGRLEPDVSAIDWTIWEMLRMAEASPEGIGPDVDWAVFNMLEDSAASFVRQISASSHGLKSPMMSPKMAMMSPKMSFVRQTSASSHGLKSPMMSPKMSPSMPPSYFRRQFSNEIEPLSHCDAPAAAQVDWTIWELLRVAAAPRPPPPIPLEKTCLLEKVDLQSQEAQDPDTYLGGLLTDLVHLAEECFGENTLAKILEKQDATRPWRLVLLGQLPPDASHGDDPCAIARHPKIEKGLLGFLVFNMWGPPLRQLLLLRLAVPMALRGAGYGKRLMQWAMSYARKQPRSMCGCVACSALPDAVHFYRRLGFIDYETEEGDDDGKVWPGQVLMKFKCGRPVVATKGKKKR